MTTIEGKNDITVSTSLSAFQMRT